MISLLLRIGLVARNHDGSIRWPVSVAPLWAWRFFLLHPIKARRVWGGWFYVFRNSPGVIKRQPGRLLPRRWGVGFAGLIEFGDRG